MKKPILKSIEGEDLIFYNYKEPLKPVEKGYGYYGVILSTDGGERIQCHICGKTYEELNAHVRQAHSMNTKDYKEKYKLAYLTVLISEKRRIARQKAMFKWFHSQTKEQKEFFKKRQREAFLEYLENRHLKREQPKLTLESKNKRGTCPDQLLARIKEVSDKLGRSPSKEDFISYYGHKKYWRAILYTFGSWVKAKEMLGYSRLIGGGNNKAGIPNQYTDEELLEYLKKFYENNGRIPMTSDCKRGLLPDYKTYASRFGSLPIAREMAGLPKDKSIIRKVNMLELVDETNSTKERK